MSLLLIACFLRMELILEMTQVFVTRPQRKLALAQTTGMGSIDLCLKATQLKKKDATRMSTAITETKKLSEI